MYSPTKTICTSTNLTVATLAPEHTGKLAMKGAKWQGHSPSYSAINACTKGCSQTPHIKFSLGEKVDFLLFIPQCIGC